MVYQGQQSLRTNAETDHILFLMSYFSAMLVDAEKVGDWHFRVFGLFIVFILHLQYRFGCFYLLKLDFCNSQDRSIHQTKTVFGWSSKLVNSFRR